MLDGLDAIDWTRLVHAYGSAGDIPGLLRDLLSGGADTRERARWCLHGALALHGVRCEASARAVPFLLELAADPDVRERHDLLLLVAQLVAGSFGVAAEPVIYAGEPDRGGDGDPVLRAVYRAAERGARLYVALLADPDPDVRGAAACVLACLWSRASEALPALRARLDLEPQPQARACLAFAVGRLLPPGPTPDPQLVRLLGRDAAPVVRLLAAVGLVRLHGERSPIAAVDLLIDALSAPDRYAAYDDLPCGEHDLAGDIGAVVRDLPPALGRRALPALCGALERADDWDSVGLVAALLALSFSDGLSDMFLETLSSEQREVLSAMVRCRAMWTIGEVAFMLRARGLPGDRETLAAWLGLPIRRDPAADAAAQGRFFLIRMGDPARAADHFVRAVELRPDDAGLWLQLADALLAGGRRGAAIAAADRALALAPDDGRAWFVRGQAAIEHDPRAAADAFARAATHGFLPAVARCNEATALGLAGDPAAASTRLDALVTDEPDFAEGHYCRGLRLYHDDDPHAAIEALTRALALRRDHAPSHYARACAHWRLRRRDAALADVARAIDLDPELRDEIAADPDFEGLVGDPTFERLVAWEPRLAAHAS